MERRYSVEAKYTGGKSRDWIGGLTASEASRVINRVRSENPAHVVVCVELTPEEVHQLESDGHQFGFHLRGEE